MSILNENDRLSPSDLKGYAVCIKLFGNKIKSPTFGLWLNILLFKNDFEKRLYKKIQEIRKYFTSLGSREDCKKTLEVLADAKTDVSNFFDNVIVNDEDEAIKKNRLELMQLLCKTFNNYLNFSDIESAQ